MRIFRRKESKSSLEKVKDASKNVDSAGDIQTEGPLDFANMPKEYEIVKVPITLGYNLGDVYVYWEKGDPIHEKFRDLYRDKLCDQLNKKKHNDSVKEQRDVGPVAAVANFVDDGDYKKFLNLFNEYMLHEIREAIMEEIRKARIEEGAYNKLLTSLSNPITQEIHDDILTDMKRIHDDILMDTKEAIEERKLKHIEHVFLIKDERTGKFYHIMPADSGVKQAYELIEQTGLILASVAWSLKEKIYEGSITEDDCSKAIVNWIEDNNKINADKARKILEGSMASKLEGSDKEYKNCIIFENVAEKMREMCTKK